MNTTHINNASVLDVVGGQIQANQRVVIENGKIARIEPMSKKAASKGITGLDLKGKTLMPGLIDAHVHVMAWTANEREMLNSSPHYNALRSAEIMRDMLMRGFTTVRDAAGADYGLQRAVDEDLLPSPRLYICGRSLSQTGGHTDSRGRGEVLLETISSQVAFGNIVDGVPEVRRACREEIRRGANHIKLMLGGGIASQMCIRDRDSPVSKPTVSGKVV